MEFARELEAVLPPDVPRRETVISQAARHLELIVEANQYMNLTRIVAARDAAIKHVYDSVAPWHLFADSVEVLDAGSGAGFPGIPLALVFPGKSFTLMESIGKKARFLEAAVAQLGLANVRVAARRAEDVLKDASRAAVLTGRAVAPLEKAVTLFGPALSSGMRALFYKGPDSEVEITAAAAPLRRLRLEARVAFSYDLPDAAGTRTIIAVQRAS